MYMIRAGLPAPALTHFEGLGTSFFIKNLANHDYSGQDKELGILNEAILNQVAVRAVYCSASKGREVISEFHPYGMVVLHASLYRVRYLADRAFLAGFIAIGSERLDRASCVLEQTSIKHRFIPLARLVQGGATRNAITWRISPRRSMRRANGTWTGRRGS
ncbi:MAG: hypothetical protein ACQESR_02885 [Planctomycetota bacterium]